MGTGTWLRRGERFQPGPQSQSGTSSWKEWLCWDSEWERERTLDNHIQSTLSSARYKVDPRLALGWGCWIRLVAVVMERRGSIQELILSNNWCGFPGGSDCKEIRLQCGRPGFDPWVGKIPWRRKWQPTPVFLPGESHGRRSLVGYVIGMRQWLAGKEGKSMKFPNLLC